MIVLVNLMVGCKVDEITGSAWCRRQPDAVINVGEQEASDGASMHSERGLLNITNKKAGTAKVHTSANGYTLLRGIKREVIEGEDKFRKTEESISVVELTGSLLKEEPEVSETFLVGNEGEKGTGRP